MKRTIFIIGILLSTFAAFAQSSSNSVKGRVLDAEKNTPVEFAGVMLLNPKDSLIVQGGMTDKEGNFGITDIPDGQYLVKTLILGYKDWFSAPISLNKNNRSIDLGTITLSKDAQVLQGAEIVYVRPLFEQKAGKTVMNVESHPSAAGDNVIELLRKMPGITVDNNDNVSIQGKSGALILIDDRDPHLSGDDLTNYLKNMPSSAVDQIEVIKHPSARYDASGTAGIINIVTKKDKNKGINGSVWAGVGYNKQVNANAGFNLNARIGKVGFTGSYYYMYYPNQSGKTRDYTSIYQDVTTRQTVNENPEELWGSKGTWQSHGINFGMDYFIDKRNSMSLSYRGDLGLGNQKSNQYNRIYRNNELISSYLNNDIGKFNHGNHQINFNYKHDFDTTGKTLYADITYSINNSLSDGYNNILYYSDNFITPMNEVVYHNLSDPNQMHVVAAKLDYEHPFNDKISMECGIKSSFTRNYIISDNFLNDSLMESMSNHFNYFENINAAYILGNFTVSPQVSLQAGLRAEQTNIRGELLNTGEVNKQHYIDVFPSFQIDYNLPKMNTLSFNYRSRINRPSYWELNPYINISDAYNISRGNPYLNPEYIHSISIEHSWMFMLFTTLSYNFTRGSSEDMLFIDKETQVKLEMPENIGKSHSFSASVFTRIPIGKWWVMMYSVNYNIGRATFDYSDKVVKKTVNGLSLYTSQEFTFCKNYSIEVAAFWNPKSQTTFGTTDGRIYVWGGFKAQFLKKKLTLRLGVNDIFNNGSWKFNNIYPDGSTSNGAYYWRSRSVSLNISYRFGKQEVKMRQRKSGNDDEFSRMGGGNQGGAQGGGQGTGQK